MAHLPAPIPSCSSAALDEPQWGGWGEVEQFPGVPSCHASLSTSGSSSKFVDGKAGLSKVGERHPAEVALVTILCHLHGDTQRLHCVPKSRLCLCIKSQLEGEAAADGRLRDVGVGSTRLLPPVTWSSGEKKQLNKLTCLSSPATVPELVKK